MGKQEKYRSREDGRDVFEKALDFVADNPASLPVAAATVGGVGMRRALRKSARKSGLLDKSAKADSNVAGLVAGSLAGSAALPASAYISQNYGAKGKRRK